MKKLLCLGIALALCAPVMAQTPALTSFSGGGYYSAYHSGTTGDTIGWEFVANSSFSITHLGGWNDIAYGGMETTHHVGIWDLNQNLLASVVVDPTTATAVGDFLYQQLSAPLAVVAGQHYVIGEADFVSSGVDYYVSSVSASSWSPEVTWVNSRYPASLSMGFAFPSTITTSVGRFGPNFLFPEPTTFVMLAGLALLRRR